MARIGQRLSQTCFERRYSGSCAGLARYLRQKLPRAEIVHKKPCKRIAQMPRMRHAPFQILPHFKATLSLFEDAGRRR